MIVTVLGFAFALAASATVYDLQRWCERRVYERHFED